MLIGKVGEVSADKVVIDRTAGLVALAKNAVALGPQGLLISLTAEELDVAATPEPATKKIAGTKRPTHGFR